jgi:hypothetical protein
MEFKHEVGDYVYLIVRQYNDYEVSWSKQIIQDRRINGRGVDQYLIGSHWQEDESSSGEYFRQVCADTKQLPRVILKHYEILKERLDEKAQHVDEQIVQLKREIMGTVNV